MQVVNTSVSINSSNLLTFEYEHSKYCKGRPLLAEAISLVEKEESVAKGMAQGATQSPSILASPMCSHIATIQAW